MEDVMDIVQTAVSGERVVVESSGPKYPNQQLRSVSLETFFPGQFSVISRLESVQARVRERLPDLFVPTVNSNEPLALRPYQLRSTDGGESLAVAINQATFVSFDYPGYEAFSGTTVPLLVEVLGLLGINELSRVVYRYENEISIARDADGALPIQKILKLPPPPWCGTTILSEFDVRYEHAWKNEPACRTGVHARAEQEDGGDVLRITAYALLTPAGATVDLKRYADRAHEVASLCFESMITDEFRQIISGEEA
jgi:uncharacterized protein (TIGR04255 family)